MPKFTSKTQSKEPAVFASSVGEGVHGESTSDGFVAGVTGITVNPKGNGPGVLGQSKGAGAGVFGENTADGTGGFFKSDKKEGLVAETKSPVDAAIVGIQRNPTSTGAGVYGEHIAGGTAGFFRGNVIITGDASFPGADFAEDFTIEDEVFAEPGTVMALSGKGELAPCVCPYEKKVVGVVAGAGSFRSGIVMDKQEASAVRRQPIALVGKVFCKVDANYGSIEVGDLLTSSATHGHAMKASDQTRAFGAVIGKAMAPLGEGLGLIPILISLQ